MSLKHLFFLFFFFVGFLLVLNNISAMSFGISPNEITFFEESRFALINPNSFSIDFEIQGCDNDSFELIRNGSITEETTRFFVIRKNKELLEQEYNCTLTVLFQNKGHSSGGSINVNTRSKNEEKDLLKFDKKTNNYKKEETATKNIELIGVVLGSLALLIVLLAIIFFVK
jgi:hypothetical protein